MKLLAWLLLILVVLHLLRKKKAALAASVRAAASSAAAAAAESSGRQRNAVDHLAAEAMLPCAHCGVYIPHSESVVALRGQVFCSDAHRRLHRDT